MKQRLAVFTGRGQIELRSERVPTVAPGEALVRIHACALCTMEQRLFVGSQDDYPIAPGHEAAGIIAEMSPESTPDLAPGDRVAIAFLDRCMQCFHCRRGESNLCTGKFRGRVPGKLRRIGGLADYAVVPLWKLFPMPAEQPLDEIALCEPVACVIHSVHKGALRFGDDVLVVGGGTMGQLHLLLARLRGARVLLSDPDREKQQLALAHGAAAVFEPGDLLEGVQEMTENRGVDAVFVTFGHRDTAAQASAAVRRGGRIIYYGSFPPGLDTGVDPRRLHRDEVVLDGARGQTLEDWHQATRLIASGVLHVRSLISARYPLEKLAEALTHAIEPSSFRVVVVPGDPEPGDG
jgi:L-iditol 2-dehydrogenase